MNLDYFDRIWQSKEKNKEGRLESSLWDNRADDFNRYGSDDRRDKIIGLLLEKGMLNKNSTVLDIGCGPGKFALEFAIRAKHVTGVDISPKMLQYASENLAAHDIVNAEFKEIDWAKADLAALNWQKKFSLVVGIMSPAFSSRKGLEKMIEASNEYGFICHFVERQDLIGDVLKKEVLDRELIDEYGHMGLYCSLNVLWLYKLYPEIAYFNTVKEVVRPVEETAQSFIAKYEMRGELTEAQKTEIMDILRKKSEDGMVKDRTTSKIACIYWKNTPR